MLKKKIILLLVLFLLLDTVFCELKYPGKLDVYYSSGKWYLAPGDSCSSTANDIFGRCVWGKDWDCDTCEDIWGNDYDCNCGWKKDNENIPSSKSNSWSDDKICVNGIDTLHLRSGSWIEKPGCTFFANRETDDPAYGSAKCDFGYLDCTNAVYQPGSGTSCIYMGCETPCNACKPGNAPDTSLGCDSPPDPGKKAVCVARSNCYACVERDRACEYAFEDGHCDRDLTDGDSYFCYYGNIDSYSISGGSVDLDCPAFDPDTSEDLCNAPNCYDCTDPDCNDNVRCGLRANPYMRICITPVCDEEDVYCNDGRVCKNGGLWNAFCARPLQQGANFLSETIKPLPDCVAYDENGACSQEGPEHLFVVYERAGRTYLDIYYDEDEVYAGTDLITDYTVVMRRISNGAYFTLNGQVYRVFFSTSLGEYIPSEYTLDVFTVDFYDRLTYDIFPVCGNGICETCESLDNCIHYPPESCMSCPVDCPYVEDVELNEYNEKFPGFNANFGDILTDNDLSCKIETLDQNSICNPLCVTHNFIDANGCVYNRYRPAQPVNEEGRIISGKFGNRTAGLLEFKEDLIPVVFDKEGGFLGEAHEDSYFTVKKEFYQGKRYPGGLEIPHLYEQEDLEFGFFFNYTGGNSECISDCECATSHCSKTNPIIIEDEEYGHCCPEGYEWSNKDDFGNLYCDGLGHLKDKYKDFFKPKEDGFGGCAVEATLGVTPEGAIDYSVSREMTDFVCSTAEGSPNIGECFGDKSACVNDGFDPICTYQQLNGDYEPIQANGVWQCRKVDTITETVIPDIKCIVHSHAWAVSECQDLQCHDWGCVCLDDWNPLIAYNPHHVPYCVTDNIAECAGALDINMVLSSDVVLRSISYEEFCTTEALVCGYDSKFTNSKPGGRLDYNNCPQDALGNVPPGGWDFQIGYNSPDHGRLVDGRGTSKEFYSSYEITIGRYCSVFGNDFERIMENKERGREFKTGDCDSTRGAEPIYAYAYSDASGFIDAFGLYSFHVWYEAFSNLFTDLTIGQTYHYLVNTESVLESGCNNGRADFFTTGGGDKGDNGEDYMVMKTHLPSIDRDSSEELYHYLFNYETCKEIYGNKMEFKCDWDKISNNLESWDENRYPTHPETGITNFKRHKDQEHILMSSIYQHDANENGVPVYSRKFCESFWEAYEKEYGEYEWEFVGANDMAGSNPIKYRDTLEFSYEDVEGKKHDVKVTFDDRGGGVAYPENGLYSWEISAACIFWYEPFLDYYYSGQVPIPWYLGQIIPPWADYYRYNLHLIREKGYCDNDRDIRIGALADNDYPYE